jgi:hypothetical protein
MRRSRPGRKPRSAKEFVELFAYHCLEAQFGAGRWGRVAEAEDLRTRAFDAPSGRGRPSSIAPRKQLGGEQVCRSLRPSNASPH